MSIDNSTGNDFIAFDASTRVITIHSSDNQYGDTTYTVTITGTGPLGGNTASLTFNIVTTKNCGSVTAPSPPTDLGYKISTNKIDTVISIFDEWCHIDYTMSFSAISTPSGSDIISFDPTTRTVSVVGSSLDYAD